MKKTKLTNRRALCMFATALLLLMVSVSANAYDFSAKNGDGVTIYYNITSSSNMTCEVTCYSSKSSSNSEAYSGAVSIPATVTYDGITYTVTSIGDDAFYRCSGLTEVTIPESVTSIGMEAFIQCTKLTSVTIPESVKSIGMGAFAWCIGLKSITSYNPQPPVCDRDVFFLVDLSTRTRVLYVPAGSWDAYSKAEVWRDFRNIGKILSSTATIDSVTVTLESKYY